VPLLVSLVEEMDESGTQIAEPVKQYDGLVFHWIHLPIGFPVGFRGARPHQRGIPQVLVVQLAADVPVDEALALGELKLEIFF
jgi:hypothetical protein